MTADAELAVARAGPPPPNAVLEVLQVPVLVLGPAGQLLGANAAARRVMEAGVEASAAEELLRALAHEAWQANRPVERELAVDGPPPWFLRARVTPLAGGAAVELAVAGERTEPGLAARLAQRIRDDSTRLLRLVDGSPGPAGPEAAGSPSAVSWESSAPEAAGATRDPVDPSTTDPALPPAPAAGRLSAQDVTLDVGAHTVWVRGERVDLPFKEFEVLRLLLEHAGRVVPRRRLIERVWGRDFAGDPKTLDVHVKRLRAKIEPDPASPRHIVTVRGLGYKFEP